ncbi:MAG: response regulator transcription factor [Candidatus Nanopelagicales bacterium]
MIGVLIVDDDTLVRTGLRLMIETQADLYVVGEADNGDDAVRLCRDLQPDIVLMDIRMPGTDGLQATRRLTSADAGDEVPRVIILTTFELDDYVFEAVRAGASGFLLKRTRAEDLLDGIRTVAGGDALLSPSVTRRLMREFARTTSGAALPIELGDLDTLTQREREVLIHIGHGLSNREIAQQMYLAESTVKTYVKHILMKLGLRDRVHAVVYAYEAGLMA